MPDLFDNPELLSYSDDDISTTEVAPELELEDPLPTFLLPEAALTERSFKAHFGMGSDSPGFESIKNDIANGREKNLRQSAVIKQQIKDKELRYNLTKDILKSDAPPSEEMAGLVTDVSTGTTYRNPDTILEENFGHQFVGQAPFLSNNTDIFKEAFDTNAEVSMDIMDVASGLIAKRERAQAILQEAEGNYQQLSTLGTIGAFAEQIIPMKSWANIYDAVEKAPTESNLPGNNIREQIQYLYSLPTDEFDKQLKQAVRTIGKTNELDALWFAQAALTYGANDGFLDNLIGVADLGDVASLGVFAAAKAAGGASKVGRTVTALKELRKPTAKATPEVIQDVVYERPSVSHDKIIFDSELEKAFNLENTVRSRPQEVADAFEAANAEYLRIADEIELLKSAGARGTAEARPVVDRYIASQQKVVEAYDELATAYKNAGFTPKALKEKEAWQLSTLGEGYVQEIRKLPENEKGSSRSVGTLEDDLLDSGSAYKEYGPRSLEDDLFGGPDTMPPFDKSARHKIKGKIDPAKVSYNPAEYNYNVLNNFKQEKVVNYLGIITSFLVKGLDGHEDIVDVFMRRTNSIKPVDNRFGNIMQKFFKKDSTNFTLKRNDIEALLDFLDLTYFSVTGSITRRDILTTPRPKIDVGGFINDLDFAKPSLISRQDPQRVFDELAEGSGLTEGQTAKGDKFLSGDFLVPQLNKGEEGTANAFFPQAGEINISSSDVVRVQGKVNRGEEFYPGANLIKKGYFNNIRELMEHVVWHEVAHSVIPQAKGQTTTQYENIINAFAYKKMVQEFEKGKSAFGPHKIDATQGPTLGTNNISLNTKFGTLSRHTVQAAGQKTLEDSLAVLGNVTDSAKLLGYKKAQAKLKGLDPLNDGEALNKKIPSVMDPTSPFSNPGSLSAVRAQRLADIALEDSTAILDAMGTNAFVTRNADASLNKAFENAERVIRQRYSHVDDAVLDVNRIMPEETSANVGIVEVKYGTPDGKLFGNEDTARFKAREYGLPEKAWTIEQQGSSYYISVLRNIDETQGSVRDLQIEATTRANDTMFNVFMGVLRSPEGKLAELANANRKITTAAPNELHRLMKAVAGNLNKLSKKEADKLERVLEENRDFLPPRDENVPGVPVQRGKFHNTVGELEEHYMGLFDELPTDNQIAAYFSFKRMNDAEYWFRNINFHKDMTRQGVERISITFDLEDLDTGKFNKHQFDEFPGRVVDNLPEGTNIPEYGLWVYDSKTRKGFFRHSDEQTASMKEDIDRRIAEGYKIIQVANPLDRPIRELAKTNEPINFILVKEFQGSKYGWEHIPYQPGGHVIYEDNWWLKQPIVRRILRKGELSRHAYEGDVSILSLGTEAEVKKYAPILDRARILLKEGKNDEFNSLVSKSLFWEPDELRAMFTPTKRADGTELPPKLSLDDPITFTQSGKNVFDMDHAKALTKGYKGFTNEIRTPYNIFQDVDKKFVGHRDPNLPRGIEETGTDGNPLYKLDKPRLLRPLRSLNTGLANVMRSRYVNDYKIFSAEHFIEEFSNVMSISKEELRLNPMHYLHNPPWDTATSNTHQLRLAQGVRRSVIDFLGTKTPLSSQIELAQRKLVNSIYTTLGQGASNFVTAHMLPTVSDPFTYARSIAFHTKLGLFNPVQLFLQAQTFTNIMGIVGVKEAASSGSAAFLMRRLGLTGNESIINDFAAKAGKWGWTKEDFLESYTNLRKTGFDLVEGETAWKDDITDPELFRGKLGEFFLNKGTFFFKEGERIVRMSAWNAAFREFKTQNPGKVINNVERNKILNRADFLSAHMTRASNAAWQQGIFSVPTQFFGYQARLAEQFLSKKLTPQEWIRSVATYSALYGIPTTAGTIAGVWPFYQDVRQYFLEQGDVDLKHPVIQALNEGLISTAISVGSELATGKAQYYNWSERYGPGGLSIIKEIYKGEKDLLDIVLGASGSIVGDIISSADPVARSIYALFSDDAYPVVTQDFLEVAQNVSSLNAGIKAYYMMNAGAYITKNQVFLKDDVTTMDALFTAFTGLTPREVSDTFIMLESLKEQREAQKEAKKWIVKYFRQGMEEAYNGNEEQAKIYFTRARGWLISGGFNQKDSSAITGELFNDKESTATFGEAVKKFSPLYDKVKEDFWKKAPREQMENRFNKSMSE